MSPLRLQLSIPALVLLLLTTQIAVAAERFSFAAMGDMPYREAHIPHVERLITRINALRTAFTVHVGDIKSGVSPCDDNIYVRTREMLDRFEAPLVYLPGDNEWTDCHRTSQPGHPGHDPLERLQHLRGVFYTGALSLGRNPMPLQRQSGDPRYAKFVENAQWQRGGVHFATVHVVGSNNNLQRNQAAVNEYIERNAANLAWINNTFDKAEAAQAPAVVVVLHADPWWELDGREDQRAGFTDTIRLLKDRIIRFAKPVLLIHGDKHRFIVDKPLYQNRQLIYNATRLMVFGDREIQGVVVNVDTGDADVFSFRTLTVPENVEPHAQPKPAP